MSKFIKQSKKTITQIAHMPNGAYVALQVLAKDHNAEIVKADNGRLTLTFDEVKTAQNVANRFEADYTEAHNAYVPKSASKPATAQKGKKADTKKSKPSSTKKGNAKKMTLDDFIINNPSCTREEAKAYGFKGTRADLRARKVELGVR